jgi:hypothetical protein
MLSKISYLRGNLVGMLRVTVKVGKRDKPIDEAHGGNPKSARDVLDGRTLKRGRCWDALLSRGRDYLGGRVSHRGCGAK